VRADPRPQTITIVKVNGARNDFALLDQRPPSELDYGAIARALCERSGPIGADGLLVVLAGEAGETVAAMRIYNADGTEAEMCGNGIRCVARYLWERGEVDERFAVGIPSGSIGIEIDPGPPFVARADLGVPRILHRYADGQTVDVAGEPWRFAHVAVPNDHIVAFVPDVAAIDLEAIGALLSSHPRFARGTNVHVAQVAGGAVRARHYERGVGLTQACGTGAVAVAVAAIDDGRVDSPVDVVVPGGTLRVTWQPGARALLEGPAEIEYERTIPV
jgi:diaminopimelate epimerase